MNSNYDASLANVLNSEGLWSDNPADPGGATMKGITLEVYRSWKRNPHITKDELKAIPDEDVYALYRELYWDKICGDSLKDELKAIPDEDVYALYRELYWDKICGDSLPIGIDYAVFDAAVNMGVGRASKLLQEAIGVTADGVIGNGTLNVLAKENPMDVLQKFSHLKEAFYRSLSTFPTFGKGWLSRVAQVTLSASSMIA